jgi:hypothetical protein
MTRIYKYLSELRIIHGDRSLKEIVLTYDCGGEEAGTVYEILSV